MANKFRGLVGHLRPEERSIGADSALLRRLPAAGKALAGNPFRAVPAAVQQPQQHRFADERKRQKGSGFKYLD